MTSSISSPKNHIQSKPEALIAAATIAALETAIAKTPKEEEKGKLKKHMLQVRQGTQGTQGTIERASQGLPMLMSAGTAEKQKEIDELRQKVLAQEAEKIKATEEKTKLERSVVELKADLEGVRNIQQLQTESFKAMDDSFNAERTRAEKLEQEAKGWRTYSEQERRAFERLQKEKIEIETAKQSLQSKLDGLETEKKAESLLDKKEIAQLKEQLGMLQKELESSKSMLESERKSHSALQKQHKALENQNAERQKLLQVAREKIEALGTTLSTLQSI